ncbi:hemin uptake protein HemP [Paraburkholderia rhizosphaerae]|uniref:Hemin uptake protein HemP n=1 Tax=Paraburkholderia rhizosphaerae TaxID=480658 RepID=A0A4R8L860_9BURK|nr:hemin uptake protein HemP [Paraburkholderia rhizosphaerae]TDY38952.1 hemin uptake protein HemP [Paraburkholderia rhizosphaerae]
MTNLTRSSTLSLRRPASQALTTSRASKASTLAATPSGDRPERTNSVSADIPDAERVIRSDTLLQGRSHVSISHNGETYQLRATRLGKLILTK